MDFYNGEETNWIRIISMWIVDIIVAIAFAWFCVYSFGTQVKIAGQSMLPGLRANDEVLMNRLVYDFGNPKRFDVVVFEREEKKTNVKRVIGLPGEEIQIRDGLIYINDRLLETAEEYGKISLSGLAENTIVLGEDEYFLLGDNRDVSEDSRFASIGNVKKKQITGKVWLRIMPVIDVCLVK